MRLAERVAIVTGGGKGIGRHYVHGLAKEGAAVVIAEIDGKAAEQTAKEVTDADGQALAVQTDVSDEASVKNMVERTLGAFGRVDVLVNNAAVFASVNFTHGPHDRISVEEWDRMFAVNVRGVWLCSREVIPHMRKQGYGKIINIASGTAWKGTPNMLHYVTSKAAVAGLTRALAKEIGGNTGICVNAVAPGFTESDSLLRDSAGGRLEEQRERTLRDRIIQRAEQPEDLVGAVVFLASADSDFITGQNLHVDGGSVLT
jgi:3-oxoacyl-[acyl-carrier protein] reductase